MACLLGTFGGIFKSLVLIVLIKLVQSSSTAINDENMEESKSRFADDVKLGRIASILK